jgi:hypothetical protein
MANWPNKWSFLAQDFQTLADSVIPLDLTKIIAFDAVRERERSGNAAGGATFRKWAETAMLLSHEKKQGFDPEQQKRVSGYETHCESHSRRGRARNGGLGRFRRHA